MNDTDDRSEQEIAAFLARARPLPPSPEFVSKVEARLRARVGVPTRAPMPPARPRMLVPMALAATVALALGVGVGFMAAMGLHSGRRVGVPRADTEPVRFTLVRPAARAVALTGDFTNWAGAIPLRRSRQGVWSVTVPLKPGQYEYAFVINGKAFVPDPHAVESRPDGFGHRNAVLTVPTI